MAVNESRSLRGDLLIGTSEGGYKCTWKDRGGEMSADTLEVRRTLSATHYDVQDTTPESRHQPTGKWGKHMLSRGI